MQVVNSVTFERKLRGMAAACGREWIGVCVGEEGLKSSHNGKGGCFFCLYFLQLSYSTLQMRCTRVSVGEIGKWRRDNKGECV
jgi:hypothetical protein